MPEAVSSVSPPSTQPAATASGTPLLAEEQLTSAFLHEHPRRGAGLLESLATSDAVSVLLPVSDEIIAAVLHAMLPHAAAAVLQEFPEARCLDIVPRIPPAYATAILQCGTRTWQATLFAALSSRYGLPVLQNLAFDEHTIGRLMNPYVPRLTPDRTVSHGIEWIQNHRQHHTEAIYIVTRRHQLLGYVRVQELLIRDLDAPMERIATPCDRTLRAHWSITHAAECPFWGEYPTLPVLGRESAFLGVLTYHTLMTSHQRGRAESGNQLIASTKALPATPPLLPNLTSAPRHGHARSTSPMNGTT